MACRIIRRCITPWFGLRSSAFRCWPMQSGPAKNQRAAGPILRCRAGQSNQAGCVCPGKERNGSGATPPLPRWAIEPGRLCLSGQREERQRGHPAAPALGNRTRSVVFVRAKRGTAAGPPRRRKKAREKPRFFGCTMKKNGVYYSYTGHEERSGGSAFLESRRLVEAGRAKPLFRFRSLRRGAGGRAPYSAQEGPVYAGNMGGTAEVFRPIGNGIGGFFFFPRKSTPAPGTL